MSGRTKAVIIILVILVGLSVLIDKCMGGSAEARIISTEEELRDALNGRPQLCIVENAVITGEPVEDAMGIFDKDLVYLSLEEETFESHLNPDVVAVPKRDPDDLAYSTEWTVTNSNMEPEISRECYIYGDIPFALESYYVYAALFNDNELPDGCYYINGDESRKLPKVGDVRYKVSEIENGRQIAFSALIGDGMLTPEGLEEGYPSIYLDNDAAAAIEDYNDRSTILIVLLWIVGLSVIIPILISGRRKNQSA